MRPIMLGLSLFIALCFTSASGTLALALHAIGATELAYAAAPPADDENNDDADADDAGEGASVADDSASSGGDEAIPVPEPEDAEDEDADVATASATKDSKNANDDEDATEADDDASSDVSTDKPEADDDQSPSVTKKTAKKSTKSVDKDDDDVAPKPPGGTLADRLSKSAASATKKPRPVAFHSVRAGETTVSELHKAWGAPLSTTRQKQVAHEIYRLEDHDRVEVHCFRETVQSVTVYFDSHPRWKDLAVETRLNKVDAVDVYDEFGELMGLALPEKGVIVAFEPKHKDRRVTQMIYDVIDPQTFTLRAERRMAADSAGCERDLELAIAADPQFARAYWLRARMLRESGQIEAATKAASQAVKLEPKNAQYHLTRAALLADAGQFIKAIEETRRALELCGAQPELKACALNQLGEQLASGPGREYKKALPLHMEAIKLAEPLAQDRRATVRRTAKEAVLTAHLCAARNIAWGDWKMKKKMVPSWLNRARELADEIDDEPGTSPTGLRVCREALTACVGMEGDLDPTPWIEKALALAVPVIESSTDPIRRRQLNWELGSALYDALQVYHATGDTTQAMKYGALAVEHLEAGAEERQLEPVEAYLLGRLYYRMGAVCAMELKEPSKAVSWFERAMPLLERPIPAAALSDAGRHGESFVSMAVSYWASGNHDEAMRLTRQGLKLMEQAVKDGYLDEDALRVPYTNLSTMHRFLGDDEQADSFETMASKAASTRR